MVPYSFQPLRSVLRLVIESLLIIMPDGSEPPDAVGCRNQAITLIDLLSQLGLAVSAIGLNYTASHADRVGSSVHLYRTGRS